MRAPLEGPYGDVRYDGFWSEDMKHGQGKLTFVDGDSSAVSRVAPAKLLVSSANHASAGNHSDEALR